MKYRLQDFMKYIIPGLYIVFCIFIWEVLSPQCHIQIMNMKDFTGIIIILIPFVGFVIGYFVECLMTFIEHLFYLFGGKRPSYTILKGDIQLYVIAGNDKILHYHGLKKNSLNNKNAGKILQIAKQKINREKVETFRINSILARNIFGAQVILSIAYASVTDNFCCNKFWRFSIILCLIFLLYWIHHNHVYVKYVLAEYAEILENDIKR